MKISIIIPYRDRRRSIYFLIKEFQKQQGFLQGNMEIIIVNLGSSKVLDKHKAPNLHEINIDYDGIFSRGYCCNVGAKKAKYDIIWFVDADCVPHVRLLEYINSNFDMNNPNFAINVPVMFLNEQATESIINSDYSWEDYIKYKNDPHLWLKPRIDGTSQVCMFKRNFIELGGYDETFIGHGAEDLLIHDQIAKLLPNYWGQWPKTIEVKWSIERDLILTHLYHGKRNYHTPYMSNYRKNWNMYKAKISSNIMRNNSGREWGLIEKPPIK